MPALVFDCFFFAPTPQAFLSATHL
jgi:hypothetical protein